MIAISNVRPLNRWNNDSIRPGAVGTVGDVNLTPRFKQSAPSMKRREDPHFSGVLESRLGANVTDGQVVSCVTNGGSAETLHAPWGGKRSDKTRLGWIHQDLRVTDRTVQAYLGANPQFDWNTTNANVYRAMHTGNQFLPLPNGYAPGPDDVLRGGNYPRMTATEMGGPPPPVPDLPLGVVGYPGLDGHLGNFSPTTPSIWGVPQSTVAPKIGAWGVPTSIQTSSTQPSIWGVPASAQTYTPQNQLAPDLTTATPTTSTQPSIWGVPQNVPTSYEAVNPYFGSQAW